MIRPCFDLKGKIFGRWTVLDQVDPPKNLTKKSQAHWLCLCSCGHKSIVLGYSLRSGKSKSCGCSTLFHFRETMLNKGCK